MKFAVLASFILLTPLLRLEAQPEYKTQNIFIVTTDGFRWQELYNGADSTLLSDPSYVQDTALARNLYWDRDPQKRRALLMPFIWHVINLRGQLYGNRHVGNQFNVRNLYKISYPGYNEILTGSADPGVILNLPRNNHNITLLEFLNEQVGFRGRVVAFSSWNIFPFILNRERSKLPINSGYDEINDQPDDSTFQLIARVQENVVHKTHCRYDWLTFLNAKEYIEKEHPRVVYIGLGETDEFAHGHHYDLYLQQATAVDKMIGDLWYYIQTSPFYKDKTTLIITTDHGRGSSSFNWSNHSFLTPGSSQTWLAALGPDIDPVGEIKTHEQLYAKQLAATIAQLLGTAYQSNRSIGKAFSLASSPAYSSAAHAAVGSR